jgi:fumarate reductase subunit C
MLREVCSFLVAFYSVLILAALAALSSGQAEDWNAFLAGQHHPAWVAFHAFALVYFLAYQTVPWFKLAPKAMPMQLGGKEVPANTIVAGHYLVWVIVTAAVFWLTGVF